MAHNKPKPTRTPTPPGAGPRPSPVPEAPGTASRRSRLAAHRQNVATAFTSILKEATPSQRTSLKGVTPKAVESIGTVGGRAVSGRTFFRSSGAVGAIQRGLQGVGLAPKSGIQISRQGKDPTINVVRHETGHAVLFKQGVPSAQQHGILDRTRSKKGNQIDLPSIRAATRTKTSSTARGRSEARHNLRKRRQVLSKRR